jgi:hypothetical protein
MSKKHTFINISGGSTRIRAIYKSLKVLLIEKKVKVDVITGVSAPSLISVAIALELYDELEELLEHFDIEDIFSSAPLTTKNLPTNKGLLRASIGLITPLEIASLGDMKPLENKLRNLITPKRFEIYKNKVKNGEAPKVYIGVFSLYYKRPYIIPVYNLDNYEDFIKYTIASATIPIAAQPVKIGNDYFVDGGVADHAIGGKVVKRYVKNKQRIKKVINIWTRPDISYDPFIVDTVEENFKIKNIVNTASIIGSSLLKGISESDEESYNNFYKSNLIKTIDIHFPSITKGTYDTDPERLAELDEKAIQLTRNKNYEI